MATGNDLTIDQNIIRVRLYVWNLEENHGARRRFHRLSSRIRPNSKNYFVLMVKRTRKTRCTITTNGWKGKRKPKTLRSNIFSSKNNSELHLNEEGRGTRLSKTRPRKRFQFKCPESKSREDSVQSAGFPHSTMSFQKVTLTEPNCFWIWHRWFLCKCFSKEKTFAVNWDKRMKTVLTHQKSRKVAQRENVHLIFLSL